MNSIYVGIGGAVGAILRFFISETLPLNSTFPMATLCINLLGSLLLSFLLTSTTIIQNVHIKLALTTGVLGAFTTFSTFSYETLQLVQNGLIGSALLYVVCSLCGGIACGALGVFVARRLAV